MLKYKARHLVIVCGALSLLAIYGCLGSLVSVPHWPLLVFDWVSDQRTQWPIFEILELYLANFASYPSRRLF